tara:strand:+ start:16574 stop:17944 length:1371 start_codon:yes stop_codon:yes gene_type:complete
MIDLNSKSLQKLYIAYFGRPGDPSGINYWLSQANGSLTFNQISDELSRQDEYKNSINNKSLDFQINKLYLNLFDRKADFNGLNYWIEKIHNQGYQISYVVCNLTSIEKKPYPIQKDQEYNDMNVLKNKIFAAEMFTGQISKSISLINLYQPDSISPWRSGNSLIRASNFLSKVNFSKVTIDDVNRTIDSLSDVSIKVLTKPVIELKDISLSIPIFYSENRSLTKKLFNKVTNLTGGELSKSTKGTHVIALNKINLTFMRGERVGLIGHNGSGKSSFLRLISGIYMPTTGVMKIGVDVYPMLQKTFLTSSELSGIDACKAHYLLMNHSLKGFESFLNEIIEFSGLGSYISLPIKTYSEGMSARLIFSILTSSSHDCLAIDEGFGTGDTDFFDRAEARMEQFMESAATLFLASHSEELLKQFCNRGIVFSHGSIAYDGPLDAALNYYHTHDYYQKNVS